MTLRDELIQVAAVAVAMVEDLDSGYSDAQHWGYKHHPVLWDVYMERMRQDRKWGKQHHRPFTWMQILMEEVGEAAEQVRLEEFGEDIYPFLLRHIERAGELARRWLRENLDNQS